MQIGNTYTYRQSELPPLSDEISDCQIKIRQLNLRLAHLNRVQNSIINLIRLDLMWQFPEVAFVSSQQHRSYKMPPLWGWLAGERSSAKYDRLYEQTVGLGLSGTVRRRAARLCDLQREKMTAIEELQQLLTTPP